MLLGCSQLLDQQRGQMRPAGYVPIHTIRNRLMVAYMHVVNMHRSRIERGEKWKRVMISPQIHVLAYGNQPNT